jgi:hypothetical protein
LAFLEVGYDKQKLKITEALNLPYSQLTHVLVSDDVGVEFSAVPFGASANIRLHLQIMSIRLLSDRALLAAQASSTSVPLARPPLSWFVGKLPGKYIRTWCDTYRISLL